jgi:hypothetical protein
VASVAGLLLALAAILTAATISAQACARYAEVSARALRIQGREWCLGATALPTGQRITCGRWVVSHKTNGDRVAEGATGTYRIASDGSEHWRLRRARP